ncbi:Smr/MutS family protein [Candidatus Pelagibacter sp.]|nr:Smr/MutS family protein [Candidatus Pelagibacter sp.]
MKKDISDKDRKDWEEFVTNNEKLPDKDIDFQKKNIISTKVIDLHGFTLDKANKTIEKFIKNSFLEKVNKIIVVTGKGLHSQNEKDPYVSKKLSILKYSVPEFIKKNIDLMKIIYEIKVATIEDGGEGAFYIYLKKNKFTK